jgi:hypothetical protein
MIAFDELPDGTRRVRHIDCPDAKWRRDKLKSLGICINAPLPAELRKTQASLGRVVHGSPVGKAGKCQRCVNVHAGRKPGDNGPPCSATSAGYRCERTRGHTGAHVANGSAWLQSLRRKVVAL